VNDQEDKNIEQIGEEAEAVESARQEGEEISKDAASPERAQKPVTPAPTPPARKGSSAIAWLALLLVLALAGAAGWVWLDLQRREAVLLERLGEVETLAGSREDNLDRFDARWQQELRAGLAGLEEADGRLQQLVQGFNGELQGLDGELDELRVELARFSATDRDSWLLAEAEYLLRLANQRLIMAGDTLSAKALLGSADKILRELDEPGLHEARGALAADLAAVRAVPEVDVEGIYLRLAALIEQADKLVIFQMPEAEPRLEDTPAEDWQDRLREGYESALTKLSDYVIIRRRDVPMQALMDPQWEGLVRQNLRMLLEQSQVALLSSNQVLYAESLSRANHWVAEFFESDEAAARAMAREIDQLADQQIAVDIPDLSRSLDALGQAIEKRLEQGGGE
jgi:uroporphyrin-3 C-methyltransferase